MSTLYIIGNGFDLAHGLKTSYKDFFDYLRSTAEGRDLLENLSWFNDSIARQLEKKDQTDWCDFEDGFSGLNFDPAKMKNSIYGKTAEEIVVNVMAKTKALLRSFIMHSYYGQSIKPIMDLPKENALFINSNTPLPSKPSTASLKAGSSTSTGAPHSLSLGALIKEQASNPPPQKRFAHGVRKGFHPRRQRHSFPLTMEKYKAQYGS